MKNKYPIQVIDLRFQVDHNNPRKTQPFEGYRGATNARVFRILFRHREIKMISDGQNIVKLLLFKMTRLNLKDFMGK